MTDMLLHASWLQSRRNAMTAIMTRLTEGIDALKRDAMPELRAAIVEATDAWKALEADVRAHPELFVRPKKVEAHGIVFGYEKGKGGLEIADEDRTVALIEKHLPDQADVLIGTKKVPVKAALAQLTGDDLKRLGVKVKDVDDRIVIRPADGALDKLVKALVDEAIREE